MSSIIFVKRLPDEKPKSYQYMPSYTPSKNDMEIHAKIEKATLRAQLENKIKNSGDKRCKIDRDDNLFHSAYSGCSAFTYTTLIEARKQGREPCEQCW